MNIFFSSNLFTTAASLQLPLMLLLFPFLELVRLKARDIRPYHHEVQQPALLRHVGLGYLSLSVHYLHQQGL